MELKVMRDGFWRSTKKKSPIEEDVVLGMFNDGESIWLFRCIEDKGYVPVCAASTTQSESIYVSHFSWLPRFNETWRTDTPENEEPVVGIRKGSTEPEMLVYVNGKFYANDIEEGVDLEDSEVVDCIKWIDLPEPPASRTKSEKKKSLKHVN